MPHHATSISSSLCIKRLLLYAAFGIHAYFEHPVINIVPNGCILTHMSLRFLSSIDSLLSIEEYNGKKVVTTQTVYNVQRSFHL